MIAEPVRAGQVRGSVRNRPGRPDQPEARRQAHHPERTAVQRQRGEPDGSAAPERRKGSRARQVGQEAAEGRERPEGNADVDRGQEAGEGNGGEEDGIEAAAEVGLILSGQALQVDLYPIKSCSSPESAIARWTDQCRARMENSQGKSPL